MGIPRCCGMFNIKDNKRDNERNNERNEVIKIIIGQSNKNYFISHTQGPCDAGVPLPCSAMPGVPPPS